MEDHNPSLADEKRWLANLRLALEKWKSVPESSIVPNLNQWFCGTQACFGGHLMGWREFQALGVYSSETGGPMVMTPSGNNITHSSNVSHYLFGSVVMFNANLFNVTCSDHQCIVERLEHQINKLEQLIERTA